jgi:hypothetical protein
MHWAAFFGEQFLEAKILRAEIRPPTANLTDRLRPQLLSLGDAVPLPIRR